ncbi:MAG: transcription antitermination factor NusB [Eubacteriales bacterium]
MTRTNAREIALHFMFELAFSKHSAESLLEERLTQEHFAQMKDESRLYYQYPNKKQADYIRALVEGAFLHSPELDEYIASYAQGWSFHRIPKVIAALLRIAMFEILYVPEIPDSVAINDALEIAKGYDDPELISFMNGILGNFVRSELKNTPERPSDFKEDVFDLEDVQGESELPPEEGEEAKEEPVEATKEG